MAISPRPTTKHPGWVRFRQERAGTQDQIADGITRFAGSMLFVYVHIVWFGLWIALGVEEYPYGLLTMIVSLEAIFLSTFVMISQNRQEHAHQRVADEEWNKIKSEAEDIKDLKELVRQLTEELRRPRGVGD